MAADLQAAREAAKVHCEVCGAKDAGPYAQAVYRDHFHGIGHGRDITVEAICFRCRERVLSGFRAPPLAAPAPSATTTGEALPVDDPQAAYQRVLAAWIDARDVVRAARVAVDDFGGVNESAGMDDLRNAVTAYDQRNHDRATPPAAPAAVTEARVDAAYAAYLDADNGGDSRFTLDRDCLRAAIAAASAAPEA